MKIVPAADATRDQIAASQAAQRFHRESLERVRTAAVAWRNGLAGLLAGLVGFGLIKGQSDIGQLARPWGIVAGVVLLAALVAGIRGALRLMHAAYGRPGRIPRQALASAATEERLDAYRAVDALDSGVRWTLACVALLVAAVAVTWYGPSAATTDTELTTPSGTVCGHLVSVADDVMTLATPSGARIPITLATVSDVRSVDSCPG
jgi:hypothetical protein